MKLELARLGLLSATSPTAVTAARAIVAARRAAPVDLPVETGGAEAGGCEASSMQLFGSCVPKLYVYGGVGAAALALLVVLRRRRAAA